MRTSILRIFFILISVIVFSLFKFYIREQRRSILKLQADQRNYSAVILILSRNSNLDELIDTLKEFEVNFNLKYNYPYVILNDVPFTEEFKEKVTKLVMVKCQDNSPYSKRNVTFGVIPHEFWSYPASVNMIKANEARHRMEQARMPYGGSESYRHMCRFYSGFFYRHPLVADFDYFWRVEPGARFMCKIVEDPFEFMARNGIEYGFTVSIPEFIGTLETFEPTVKRFLKDVYPTLNVSRLQAPALRMSFSSGDEKLRDEYVDLLLQGKDPDSMERFAGKFQWNMCHFWNNFEIGSLRLFRSPVYQRFFEYLDETNGFFYERWGDTAVHTFGAQLLLEQWQIHHFDKLAYEHYPFQWCPLEKSSRCHCDRLYRSVNVATMKNDSCAIQWSTTFHNSYLRNPGRH